jgi:GTP-binding protein
LYIDVPINTQVWIQLRKDESLPKQLEQNLVQKLERGERYVLIKDLDEAGEYCIAEGGAGGVGNAQYTSPVYQAPQIYKTGKPGVTKTLQLRMRLAAHFGLLGAPNAGKSSLLATLTNARPIIADYPFTTINPQIGITPDRSSVIDIPGLIKGAHQNRGLGHEFLDHVAKCTVLVCVLDATDDPETTYAMLISEILAYDAELVGRIKLAVLNKVDLLDAIPKVDLGIPTIPTSTITREGIDRLLMWLSEALNQHKDQAEYDTKH